MTDEEKREKVMLGLWYCAKGSLSNCEECPYTETRCSEHLCGDALALLKRQEPRVMTLEEVKQHDNQDGCVWFEQPTYNAVAAFARQDFDGSKDGCTEIISPYLLGEPINHVYMSNTFYGEEWRCWNARPTEEQMRETPWEGENNA